MTRWEAWQRLQPNTDVVYASLNMRYREHGSRGREIAHPNMLKEGANLNDDRLPTNELVYGLVGTQRGTGLAFPLRDLKKQDHIEITYEGVPILIFLRGDYRVMAYVRELESNVLTFESVGEDSLELRDQTGTIWNCWGKAVRGPHAGAELRPVRGYMTEWYEWVSGFPNTRIYLQD